MSRSSGSLQKAIHQQRPFESASQEIVLSLMRTTDVVRRLFNETYEPHGITAQQYNVLRILRGARPDGLPTLVIRERMVERTPGVTRLIDRLEGAGLGRARNTQERPAASRLPYHGGRAEVPRAIG